MSSSPPSSSGPALLPELLETRQDQDGAGPPGHPPVAPPLLQRAAAQRRCHEVEHRQGQADVAALERDAGKRQAGQRRRHAQGQQFTDAGPPRSVPAAASPESAQPMPRDVRSWSTTAAPASVRPGVSSTNASAARAGSAARENAARLASGASDGTPARTRAAVASCCSHERQQESGEHRNGVVAAAGHGRDDRGNGQRGRDAGGEDEVPAQGLRRGARSARPRTARPAAGTLPGSSRRRGRRRPQPAPGQPPGPIPPSRPGPRPGPCR